MWRGGASKSFKIEKEMGTALSTMLDEGGEGGCENKSKVTSLSYPAIPIKFLALFSYPCMSISYRPLPRAENHELVYVSVFLKRCWAGV